MEQKSEIVLYQPEGSVSLEVRLENETVWLTQQQMSELFQTTNIIRKSKFPKNPKRSV